jgi:hypothetical protein
MKNTKMSIFVFLMVFFILAGVTGYSAQKGEEFNGENKGTHGCQISSGKLGKLQISQVRFRQ